MARVLSYALFYIQLAFSLAHWYLDELCADWLVYNERSCGAKTANSTHWNEKVEIWNKNVQINLFYFSTDWLDIIWNDYGSFHFCCRSKHNRRRWVTLALQLSKQTICIYCPAFWVIIQIVSGRRNLMLCVKSDCSVVILLNHSAFWTNLSLFNSLLPSRKETAAFSVPAELSTTIDDPDRDPKSAFSKR